jgi:two-component system, LytTR family, response regulator LytT
MKSRKACILLADDNPAIRSALALLLETRLQVEIVGEADCMENLLAGVARSHPDIVILDWELPGAPKQERVTALRTLQPALMVVVTSSRPEIAQQALAAQADAYVCTCDQPELVVQELQAIWRFPEK